MRERLLIAISKKQPSGRRGKIILRNLPLWRSLKAPRVSLREKIKKRSEGSRGEERRGVSRSVYSRIPRVSRGCLPWLRLRNYPTRGGAGPSSPLINAVVAVGTYNCDSAETTPAPRTCTDAWTPAWVSRYRSPGSSPSRGSTPGRRIPSRLQCTVMRFHDYSRTSLSKQLGQAGTRMGSQASERQRGS